MNLKRIANYNYCDIAQLVIKQDMVGDKKPWDKSASITHFIMHYSHFVTLRLVVSQCFLTVLQ